MPTNDATDPTLTGGGKAYPTFPKSTEPVSSHARFPRSMTPRGSLGQAYFVKLTFGKLVRTVPIATNTGVLSSSTPSTTFEATASLATTSAEYLRLFKVNR